MRFNAPYNAQVKLRELRFLNRQVIIYQMVQSGRALGSWTES